MPVPLPPAPGSAAILAGIPAQNNTFYRRIRFSVGDPAALVELPSGDSVLILRDIEMERARKGAKAGRVACPADYAPAGGLSGDRETATAQAAAECLRRAGVARVVADRTLPLIYAEMIRRAGIEVACDPDRGVLERRRKDDGEIACLREAQRVTESVVERVCRLIAAAPAGKDGVLVHDGAPLTADRVRALVLHWLLDLDFAPVPPIVAGGPVGADCHDEGRGALRTGEPVIVDVFPRSNRTRYYGDCTRTVVNGDIPAEVARMHAAVRDAKAAAIAAIRPGATGETVHAATTQAIRRSGYAVGLPPPGAPDGYCALTHGTGHGVGLDVHEPPLLDAGGPELMAGEAVTVEPGLYRKGLGGVRIEDLVVVTGQGAESLNRIHEGLAWT